MLIMEQPRAKTTLGRREGSREGELAAFLGGSKFSQRLLKDFSNRTRRLFLVLLGHGDATKAPGIQ